MTPAAICCCGIFSYPFGDVSPMTRGAVQARFASCRGINPGVNRGTVDLGLLKAVSIYDRVYDSVRMERYLEEARRRNGWLIFYTHDVQDSPSHHGTSPKLFEMPGFPNAGTWHRHRGRFAVLWANWAFAELNARHSSDAGWRDRRVAGFRFGGLRGEGAREPCASGVPNLFPTSRGCGPAGSISRLDEAPNRPTAILSGWPAELSIDE